MYLKINVISCFRYCDINNTNNMRMTVYYTALVVLYECMYKTEWMALFRYYKWLFARYTTSKQPLVVEH